MYTPFSHSELAMHTIGIVIKREQLAAVTLVLPFNLLWIPAHMKPPAFSTVRQILCYRDDDRQPFQEGVQSLPGNVAMDGTETELGA